MKSERGAVLSFVLMVVGVLSVLGMVMSTLVRVDTMQQNAQESVTRNFLAAEAGLNKGIGEYRNLFLNFDVPSGDDFAPRTLSIDGHTVQYQLQGIPTTPPPAITEPLPLGDAFAGLNSIRYRYSVTSQDLHADGTPRAGLTAQFDVNNVPIFQFLFFYTDQLHFAIPPVMTLHGRIHSNAELYLNDSSAPGPLSVSDSPDFPLVQVSATGRVWRGEPEGGQVCLGNVLIDALGNPAPDGSMSAVELPCNGSAAREIPKSEADAWGTIFPALGNINPPKMDVIERGSGVFWERAELRIVLDLDDAPEPLHEDCASFLPIEIQAQNGSRDTARTAALRQFMWENRGRIFYNDVPTCTARDPVCAANKDSYVPAFAEADAVYRNVGSTKWNGPTDPYRCDYRRGGFFNNREKNGPFAVPPPATLVGRGTWMRLLNIDLDALLAWNRANGNPLFPADDSSDGGIVLFATVKGPNSAGVNNYGVRIFDSPDLDFPPAAADPTGITVVSDQAIYVQGDYNTVEKAPAAIVGDSVNVLSQNWEASGNDLKSAQARSTRLAGDTTINAAFIAGVDRQLPGIPNGGVNNYPRFHEDWAMTGRRLRYRGSMVSLGVPSHVSGPFCGSDYGGGAICDIYGPPVRDWDYDADFEDVTFLPPLTPRVVWVQQALFTQEFR